uniref:Uncharacterized protein n=1 Tax=Leersia perrieri TaxID=77586 RepID=A0A0D9XXV3_9ORYZ
MEATTPGTQLHLNCADLPVMCTEHSCGADCRMRGFPGTPGLVSCMYTRPNKCCCELHPNDKNN